MLKGFKWAEIPDSTYYRTINLKTELSHATAMRVAQAVENHTCLERIKSDVRKLRNAGKPVEMRTLKARHKPRIAGG